MRGWDNITNNTMKYGENILTTGVKVFSNKIIEIRLIRETGRIMILCQSMKICKVKRAEYSAEYAHSVHTVLTKIISQNLVLEFNISQYQHSSRFFILISTALPWNSHYLWEAWSIIEQIIYHKRMNYSYKACLYLWFAIEKTYCFSFIPGSN